MQAQVRKILLLLGLTWALTACQAGGQITSGLEAPSTNSSLLAPVITIPASSTYYSNTTSLTISGLCQSGATVMLAGGALDSMTCQNSSFSFLVSTTQDGFNYYYVTQILAGESASAPAMVFWIRKSTTSPPQITSPSAQPYRSAKDQISISGTCESGSTISLSGDAAGSTVCTSSTYTINVTKLIDATYNIQVTQTDPALNSAATSFQWIKADLQVSPNTADIVVGASQIFTLQGGTGSYVGTLTTNASTAAYNDSSRTYTAGTLANVADGLTFQDSEGETVTVLLNTKNGPADHFIVPPEMLSLVPMLIESTTPAPLKVRVVDQYGNPVPNFSVDFLVPKGEVEPVASHRVFSDSSGYASADFKMGTQFQKNKIRVKPSSTTLADVTVSGNATVTLDLFSEVHSLKSEFGLQFATSSNPATLIAKDFDGDSFLDVAVLNKGDPSIGIFYGKGNGLFESQIKIQPICVGPSDLASADINGDGRLDFVLSCSGSDQLSVVLASAARTYLPVTHLLAEPEETLPVGLKIADFDKDGKLDLISLSVGGSVLSFRKGSGTGTFQAPSFIPITAGASAIEVDDFDQDGSLDMIVLYSATNQFSLMLGNGDGSFQAGLLTPTGNAPSALKSADMNSDGYPDLIVANNMDNSVSVFVNDQYAGFSAPFTYSVGQSPNSVIAADLNGDSKLDVFVTGGDDSSLTPLLGQGDGSLALQSSLTTLANPVFVTSGDINGDGRVDLITAANGDQKMQVYLTGADGSSDLVNNLGGSPGDIESFDLNNDGHKDLFVIDKSANQIKFLLGNSKGFWAQNKIYTTGNGPVRLAKGDVNRDGYLDLVVIQQNANSVRVFINDTHGDFLTPNDYATGSQPAKVILADLDQDGFPELVVANQGSGTISVLDNDGTGLFLSKVDSSTMGNKPVDLVAVDVNDDDRLDLVVVNQESNNISVFLSNGGLLFQAPILIDSGSGGNSLVAGFFNGDTKIDLAVCNELEGAVGIMVGQGNGSFTGPNTFFAGTEPRELRTGDFNGDGHSDLIVSNLSSQTATILVGNGTAQFNSTKTINLNHNGTFLKLFDVNADQSLDFISVDTLSGSLKTWLGY